MSFHAGTCYFPVGFDHSPEAIQKIPVGTIRKFGGTWQDASQKWEGEKVEALKAGGKRVIGTFTMPNGSPQLWNEMPEIEWANYVENYIANVPTKVVEIGNEPGKRVVGGYLRKLEIASALLRNDGRRVLMAAPFPGAEGDIWKAAQGRWEMVDGVGLHPYRATPAKMLDWIKTCRTNLNSLGCNKPIHLTEFGWATGGGHPSLTVSAQTQALHLKKAFELLRANAETLRLANCLWYCWNDWDPTDGGEVRWPHRCGVVKIDGSAKPSLAALQAVGA